MALRSKKREDDRVITAMLHAPLVETGGGVKRYKPYNLGDMAALLAILPPIHTGGGPFASKLLQATYGTRLAMGDVRAVISRAGGLEGLESIEKLAETEGLADEEPFENHITDFNAALRTVFPITRGAF